VVARGEGVTYFFTGDAGYTLDDMLADRTDGVTNDPATSLATIRKSKEFARLEPTIVLPAHDPDGPQRLRETSLLSKSQEALASNLGVTDRNLLFRAARTRRCAGEALTHVVRGRLEHRNGESSQEAPPVTPLESALVA
jgi:glyoxylase-like metal-dependent hydrolase (beta-lactamase superfamily II)